MSASASPIGNTVQLPPGFYQVTSFGQMSASAPAPDSYATCRLFNQSSPFIPLGQTNHQDMFDGRGRADVHIGGVIGVSSDVPGADSTVELQCSQTTGASVSVYAEVMMTPFTTLH